jgi:hypothetical protein
MLSAALYAHVRTSFPIAHETAGAARTRHSLRPLFFEGDTFKAKLARNARREREGVFSSFRDAPLGAGPESIAQQSWWINGFRAQPCGLPRNDEECDTWWIASRSLSSGARSRDPVARNDGMERYPTGKSAKAVQPHPEKYSAFAVGQISATSSPVSRPQEGRIAIVTDVGRGMRWTRWRAQDERRQCGRRSRVVPTPRRWRQVLERSSQGRRWQESPVTEESTI